MDPKRALRRLTPEFVLDPARSLRARISRSRATLPVWEAVPEGWERERTDPFVKGWNVAGIRDWHAERFPLWSRMFDEPRSLGTSQYSRDLSQQDLHSHNVHVSLAYVLTRAVGDRPSLSILDWGGGVGQYSLLARAVLPGVAVEYACKDVPLLCAAGRELLPDVTFYDDDSCLRQRFDVVVASNSLQYSEAWQQVLATLAAAADSYLYVAQLPSVERSASFVAVQRPYSHGYETEYLGWILSRDEFLAAAARSGLELCRAFYYGNPVSVAGVDEAAVHRGFLFRSVQSGH